MTGPDAGQTPTQENSPAAPARPSPVVTRRAILLGAALIPLNCYWMAVMEMQWNSLDSTCVSLFFHVVFLLIVLTLVNASVRRRFPRHALTQAELMIVYVMLSMASAVMGRDSLENLPSTLGFMWWFDDPTNRFNRFFGFVPKWMAPQDKAALKGYYIGGSSIYQWDNLAHWILPICFWVAFVLTLTWIMLCINVILRKRWTEEEKLSFPIVQIPLSVTNTSTYVDRRFLLGFAIPIVIQTMNNLNYFYPSVPHLHLKLQDLGPNITNAPWTGLGWLPVGFFPFAIGFAFFLPLDLTFSCWFFYILRKLIDVGCVAWGFQGPGASAAMAKIPYVKEQGTGAWIGLSIAMVWMSRHYLLGVWREALRTGRTAPGSADALSYRSALLGLLAGMLVLTGGCVAAGMSMWLPLVYFGFYFVLSIGITRVRAELGPPAHELNWVNPERFMVQIFGTELLGQRNLTLLSFMFWFNRGYRSHPMPHQLEAMKIGQTTRMESRRLLAAIVIATVVGAVASMWALLDVMYRQGEATPHIQSYATGIGREAFGRLQDWADNPRPTEGMALAFSGVGAGITLVLAVAKSRFVWWPFHPIGYALANSYALEYFWSALFVGWLLKLLVVRYGGARGYRNALPFFLGLILGDYVIAALWSLGGWLLGVSTYRTFIF